MKLLTRSDPRTVFNVHGGQLAVVVAHVQPAEAERTVHAHAVGRGQGLGGKAGRPAVVEATNAEAHVVLIGQFTRDEELPVNLQNAVAFHGVGGRVNLDVLRRVVGVGEHVAVLPRDHGPVGSAAGGHER